MEMTKKLLLLSEMHGQNKAIYSRQSKNKAVHKMEGVSPSFNGKF